MDGKRLVQLAHDANYSVRTYSGRSMYGKQCLGIVTEDSMARVIANLSIEVLHTLRDEAETEEDENKLSYRAADMISDLGRAKQDGMGLKSIYYWERIQPDEEALALIGDEDDD
jgi:hypothetical protein